MTDTIRAILIDSGETGPTAWNDSYLTDRDTPFLVQHITSEPFTDNTPPLSEINCVLIPYPSRFEVETVLNTLSDSSPTPPVIFLTDTEATPLTQFEYTGIIDQFCVVPDSVDSRLPVLENRVQNLSIQHKLRVASEQTDERFDRVEDRLDEIKYCLTDCASDPITTASNLFEDFPQKDSLTDEQTTQLNRCIASVSRTERMLEDIVTLISVGGEVEDTLAVDLRDVANAVWDQALTDHLTEDASLSVEHNLHVDASRDQLYILFRELFENTLVHTEKPVSITVDSKPDGTGFIVTDTGDGLATTFEPDELFTAGTTTTVTGTGLGLTIISRITESHGWDVSVRTVDTDESIEDGIQFVFTVV